LNIIILFQLALLLAFVFKKINSMGEVLEKLVVHGTADKWNR